MAAAPSMLIPVWRQKRLNAQDTIVAMWAAGQHPPAWPREIGLALADPRCGHCRGMEMVLLRHPDREARLKPCACAARRAFRDVMRRYQALAARSGMHSKAIFSEVGAGPRRAKAYTRPVEEYLADVEIVLRRVLSADELRLWRLRHAGGRTIGEAARAMGLIVPTAQWRIYHLEEKAGRAFVETRPHALWPVEQYFT